MSKRAVVIILSIAYLHFNNAYLTRVPVKRQISNFVKTTNNQIFNQPESLYPSQSTKLFSTVVAAASSDEKTLAEKLKVGFYFALWYAFNIGYNIYNKKALNMAPNLTWTIGLAQLVVGLVYVLPLWLFGLRTPPKLTSDVINLQLYTYTILYIKICKNIHKYKLFSPIKGN